MKNESSAKIKRRGGDNGGRRPPLDPSLKRVPVHIKLNPADAAWVRGQPEGPTRTIERAIERERQAQAKKALDT